MPNRASILIVDDRPDKVLALEAVLEELGQRIVRAYSGREALRELLQHEFAVILLDVNMPGMDGFETASMIRQRKSSEQTPIIFITAFGDEMHAARSYSLGAVDFILAPVSPDVLRTKVAVFVDLYVKTEQIRRQAESLQRRAGQLQKLAAASSAINGALTVQQMLQTITETARDIIGAHQAITMFLLGSGSRQKPSRTLSFTCFSEKYVSWRDRELHLDEISTTLVAQRPTATRLSDAELRSHPDWEVVRHADIPPVVGGMLAAPLNGRDGTGLGVIYLSDRFEGDFTDEDEAILVQLAQMGSIAIENSIYAEEREANRVKDEFLATLSHELRTPLNAILGWTQILRTEETEQTSANGGDPSEVLHGLEVIERNARSQAKLIEDLLDVSRITTGKMRLTLHPLQLGKIVSAAADAIRPVVEEKKIHLHCHIDPVAAEATLMGDTDRLQQVFWNLLSNAAKFTPTGGEITCRLDRVESGNDADVPAGSVRLQVTDSGAGISAKFLPFVFDRFRQADSSSTRSHGGLGIGLTIVRHIVEMHSGEVHADSAGEGKGATFSVVLPLLARAENGSTIDASHPPASILNSVHAYGQRLAGLHILVVDDEPDAREVVRQILTKSGAKVIVAASAAQAREFLRREPPDVLLSDIAMPDEDGFDLIASVRALDKELGGVIPAVALTAYAREEDRQRIIAAGFQAHLTKPVEPEQLVSTLARWVQKPGVNATAGQPAESKVRVG